MDIAILSDVDIGMPQDFAETFYVESDLNTSGSKGVPECMEMGILDTASFHDCFEAVLHSARFDIFVFISCQHIALFYRMLCQLITLCTCYRYIAD